MPEPYDVAIIGGGITGAGLLRDCALRGLRCVLLEKGSPGRATTAASTHLIHGGLRYLLYDRLTTHNSCWDSGNIVRIARALLRRLPIVWPVYRWHRRGLETVETLLESYDSFQRMKLGRTHLRLSAGETLRLARGLEPEGLLGALIFDEWWVDPVALVEANLHSAATHGAELRVGARASGLLKEGGRVRGVLVEQDGRSEPIEASLTVNAAGPWVDSVARLAGVRIPLRLRKGTHLVYDGTLEPLRGAAPPFGLLLEARDRDRYIFVVPVAGKTLVGPTDLAFGGEPDELHPEDEELRYLFDSARRYLKLLPQRFDRAIVGVRPILGQAGDEKLLSREYELFDHSLRDGVEGFMTLAGGKLSDFRLMAQEAADAACLRLGKEAQCSTHRLTLDGGSVEESAAWPRPWPPMKRFLRRHPRLRELHALGFLGAGAARHWLRRAAGGRRLATVEEYQKHYAD